jgi:hypothetical protein
MGVVLITVLMLIASNVFMTFAWYGHLKDLKDKPWLIAAMVSWCIALFEYLIQVLANRIDRFDAHDAASVEDTAGGHHVVCICPVHGRVHEATAAMGFLVGRIVHARCGIFHLPPRGHFAAG